MKTLIRCSFLYLLVSILNPSSSALAQGTAFTYQGKLASGGSVAAGNYDLRFAVYDSATSGTLIVGPVTNSATAVNSGLFTVTLDFGVGVFDGSARWLEIAVRTNGTGAFTTLTPRQALTPAPYALYAPNAGTAALAGSVAAGSITSVSLADGAVTSAKIGAGAVTSATIASNSITASQLASGAAAANLAAGGQSAVPGGGMLLTTNATDNNLLSAGYVKLGRLDAGDRWDERASGTPPATRQKHTAVWTGSEILIWGGSNPTRWNDGARYNPVTGVWTPISTNNAPSARLSHTAVWTGTEMLVWGGDSGAVVNTGGRYCPATDTWASLPTNGAPTARYLHTAVWTGSEMIIWGGYNGSGTYYGDGKRYSPALNAWTNISATGAPAARYLHTAIWTGNEMIVWGGYNGGYFNNGARYNPASDTWTAVSATGAPAARYQQTAVWTGSEMLIWGGVYWPSSTFFNNGGRYNPTTDSWTVIPTNGAPLGRYQHVAAWTGTEMLIWGGAGSSYRADAARFNPTANTWIGMTTNDAPVARTGHSAVWFGAELLVWGGYNGSSHLNDGGRYNPAADNWVAITAAAPPSPRQGASGVWTGAEVLIWGGFFDTNYFGSQNKGYYYNDGGRYKPAANHWLPMTPTSAPSPRVSHSAVWTGNEMIIWGGWDSTNYLSTGSRYNLASNTWTAVTSTGAPAGRRNHAAIWTGSEMIIWGGKNASGSLLTGARYNPTANSWAPMATNNAAQSLTRDAIWTGTEMIVWNGSSTWRNIPGARYRPQSDTWVAINTTNAPSDRLDASLVWNGTEVIVWGGYFANGVMDRALQDGGRYNPGMDSWTTILTNNAPSPRYQHVAFWTGADMLVWGGAFPYSDDADMPQFLFAGGCYNPAAVAYDPLTLSAVGSWKELTIENVPEKTRRARCHPDRQRNDCLGRLLCGLGKRRNHAIWVLERHLPLHPQPLALPVSTAMTLPLAIGVLLMIAPRGPCSSGTKAGRARRARRSASATRLLLKLDALAGGLSTNVGGHLFVKGVALALLGQALALRREIFLPLLAQLLNAPLQLRAFLLLLLDFRLQLRLVQLLQLRRELVLLQRLQLELAAAEAVEQFAVALDGDAGARVERQAVGGHRCGRRLGGELLAGNLPARALAAVGHQRRAQLRFSAASSASIGVAITAMLPDCAMAA